jgi:hypothetical protein
MSHDAKKTSDCLNCGHHFAGPDKYCPECGQKNSSLNVPFKHLFGEFVEGFLHLDEKMLSSAKYLLFKPGFLTKEFIEGRRVRFVQPVRIYVFISFIFFFLITMLSVKHEEPAYSAENKKTGEKSGINIGLENIKQEELAGLSREQADSVINARYVNGGFEKYLAQQLAKMANGGENEFTHSLIKCFSYAMFLMMPFFALLILLMNRKSYYVNALLFSIHFHSFMFLLFSIYLLANLIFRADILLPVSLILGLVYVYRSMRLIYPQGRLKALWKSLLILVVYGAVQIIASLYWVVLALAMT